MRDCPTISTRGRDVKKAPYNGLIVGEQNNNRFDALQANKEGNQYEGTRMSYFHFCSMLGSYGVGPW